MLKQDENSKNDIFYQRAKEPPTKMNKIFEIKSELT